MQVNHIGALKEAFDRHGLDFNAVREEFVAVGPHQALRHTCTLNYGQHVVQSAEHAQKKMAKQDAAERLLVAIKQGEQPTLPPQAMQVEAMVGDAVLRLVLLQHFITMTPNITPGDLHSSVTQHSTNEFLAQRLNLVVQAGLADNAPDPSGNVKQDSMAMEALFASLVPRNQGNLPAISANILALVGVLPRKAMQVEAMVGDAVLRLVLLQHFITMTPNITAGDLQSSVEQHSTNKFLAQRLNLVVQAGLADNAPDPSGNVKQDSKAMQALFASLVPRNQGNLPAISANILALVGV